MAKWIQFVEFPAAGKTRNWTVTANEGGAVLGIVKWYIPWRKYCFFPERNCVFEQDCLRDIAEFCEVRTKTHREELKASKQNGQ